jgi:Tol biopolymer transport system component
MLSNNVPFKGHTKQDVVASILKEEPAPLSLIIPDRLRWIVEKALRKDREERYQTAREMLSDLRDLPRSSAELRLATEHSLAPELKPEDRVTANIAHLGGHTDEGRVSSTGNIQSFFGKVSNLGTIAIVVLLAFLVAIGAIVIGLYKFTSRNQSQTSQNQTKANVSSQSMKMTRLTTTGKASAAAISPDGKLVVHVVDDGKQQSLWIRQVSTASNVQIIPPAEVTYLGLTFSPGGDYLYYVSWDRKSFYALYQMPMLGGAAKRLTLDIDSDVTFSPDGKQYAFLRGYPTQGKFALLVANADGTAERSLTTHALVSGPSGDPAWSPDGKIIAYPVVNTDANGDFETLFAAPVAGGSEKSISSQRWSGVGRMAWLRDGSGLLVTAKEDVASPSQIWYVSYPAGKAHRITRDLNEYQDLTLTADSTALVTVQSDQVSNIWTAPNETPSRASQVTTGKFDGLKSLSWTPDGKIVYDSAASGHLDLWVSNSNGTGQKQLTADAGNNSWPSVSPDGRYVVFVSDRTGAHHLWRIDIDGSNATQLTQGPGESNPHCSPDGQWVAFNSWLSRRPIMKVPIMGGEAIKIGIDAGGAPTVSPDGKSIASTHYEPSRVNTAIYSLEGGEPSKFLDFAGYYLRWTPDGRSLAYVDERNASAIISQPIHGGPERQLADFKPDHIFSFAWSRDGKQLAVAHGTLTNDVILISNFMDPR